MKTKLQQRHCQACKPGTPALTSAQIKQLKTQIPHWQIKPRQISRTFKFEDYYHTMAFVNAIAWMANQQDHHPDMEVGYNRCVVHYSTHSVGGLSENDFICAAKADALLE
jgi:4a-hydroxytetrahydrobiopterin dehydratase